MRARILVDEIVVGVARSRAGVPFGEKSTTRTPHFRNRLPNACSAIIWFALARWRDW